ncbi:MAG: winged helix-turn-helix domain-containing protein [Pseudomonadota bacterium]
MSDRAGKQTSQYRYRFGDAVLIESEMELYIRDARTELEHRPTELLRVLLAHADETMTKDELLSLVWQGQTTVENVLPNAITKIRRALGEVLAARIVTVPRIGYRFEGPVERIASGRKYLSRLQLEQGAPVPLRQSFLLSEQLSERDGREVWRATHAKTGETRIFKFASSGLALASLKREVTLYRLMLGSLGERAPIVKIFDWNFENEPFFIESVDGGWDLANWHAGAPNLAKYSRSERLDLCIRIVEAVAQAHSAGVLHKDLKPSNIIISSERAPFLVDFGSGVICACSKR